MLARIARSAKIYQQSRCGEELLGVFFGQSLPLQALIHRRKPLVRDWKTVYEVFAATHCNLLKTWRDVQRRRRGRESVGTSDGEGRESVEISNGEMG